MSSGKEKKALPMHDQQWNNKADERREEMLGGIGQVRGVYTARPITFNQIRVKK